MAISVTHSTVVVTPDDGSSEVGTDEWNAGHTVTGAAESATTITAGDGLTGGGDLSANRTVAVGAGTGITVNADDVQVAAAYQAVGKMCVPVPAVAMYTRTTNGADSGTAETGTNDVMLRTFNFDTTTEQAVQFAIPMPVSWNESTVTFIPIWSHPAAVTNFGVVFSLAGLAVSNDDALDQAFGTAVTSTDTGGTTDDIYHGPESAACTIAGTPAADDYVLFEIRRVVANGSDTLAVDARLHGIKLFITTAAANDA
jgi:hypothetical protein